MPRVKNRNGASGTPAAKTGEGLSFNAAEVLKTMSQESKNKLEVLSSALMARKQWGDLLGQTFGGDRDIYTEAGWKKNPTATDYKRRFERQDIARTLVSAYPDATWREQPTIREDDNDEDTEFEKAWKEHAESCRLWHYLRRFDVMAGVGSYAVMFLGLDSNPKELNAPAVSATRVLFHQLFYETDAEVTDWVTDTADERYGLPLRYKLTSRVGMTAGRDDRDAGTKIVVDQSRIIHGAEGCMESDVFGTPRLQTIHNRLEDIEKILGASGEGYWKRAFQGQAFIKDADADWGDSESDMEDEIEEYYNKLTRWMRLSGVDVKSLDSGKLESPEKHFEVQMMMLSAASRIPMRILTGSERGELASGQDEGNWLARVDERRKNFAWPVLLKPYIMRLIELGILPEPKGEISCEWPDIEALGEKEQAEVAQAQSSALKNYADGLVNGIDLVIPPYYFLVDVMHLDEDRVKEYQDKIDELRLEEDAEREEADRIAADEADRIRREEQAVQDEGAVE